MKFLRIIFFILVVYSLIVISAAAIQRSLIFYPGKLSRHYKFNLTEKSEEIFLRTSDGEEINGLFYQGTRPEVVLYFHGNAGDLSGWQYIADDFTKLGYSFFIIDYRGYGKSSGTITESGLYLDAQAAYDLLLRKGFKPDQLIIYGRSIGSGVAVELASRVHVKGVILEAPYISLKKLAREKAPYLFPGLWLQFHFDNVEKINRIRCPILFIHGADDTLIPSAHSATLAKAFSGRKKLFIIPEGTHNDLNSFQEYHGCLQTMCADIFY